MTDSVNLRDDFLLETPIPGVPLESILRTQELRERPSRSPDYETENRALVALANALADSPGTILQTLADRVLDLLHADSAGLSLLTRDEKRFYWAAIAGAWRPHAGSNVPRNSCPCGEVLDRNVPMLFTHWERRYLNFSRTMPVTEEGLFVPFYANGKPVGTIWAFAHDSRRRFDAEDLRLLERTSRFASAACQVLASIENLKLESAAREKAETAVRELANGLETQVRVRTQELERSTRELAEANEDL
ncbi:MAG: GAF domain-containing protein, partial [Candidatus Sulfotelmatobacter sp.]